MDLIDLIQEDNSENNLNQLINKNKEKINSQFKNYFSSTDLNSNQSQKATEFLLSNENIMKGR